MNGESAMSRDEDTKEFERKRELHKILIKQGRINEKKRIIALAVERAKVFEDFSGSTLGNIASQTLRNFANELENE